MMHTRMQSGAQLREQLNDRFASVGMRQIGSDETGFAYDDLIRKLHLQGRKEFDRKSFKDLVREESPGGAAGTSEDDGWRSIIHASDRQPLDPRFRRA